MKDLINSLFPALQHARGPTAVLLIWAVIIIIHVTFHVTLFVRVYWTIR